MKTYLLISFSLLNFFSQSAHAVIENRADAGCNVVLRYVKIFKSENFVFARIEVAKNFLENNPNAQVFLRVANQNGVRSITDIPATPKLYSARAKYREYEVQFQHTYVQIPSLGVLAGVQTKQSNLFDFNWNPSASYGMAYIDDAFTPFNQCR